MIKNRFLTSLIVTGTIIGAISLTSHAESGKIKGDAIRLRKEASTDSTVIDAYSDGETVEVIEKKGEWYKVTINGNTGYIYQDYVEVLDEKLDSNDNKTDEKKDNSDSNKNVEKNDSDENKSEGNKTVDNKTENNKTENNKTENNTTVEDKEQNNNIDDTKGTTVKLGKMKASSTQKVYILPNIGASKIGEVKKNSEINIIQALNGWAYILADDISGWTRYDKITNDKISTYDVKESGNSDNSNKNEVVNNTSKENNNATTNNSSKNTSTDKTNSNNNTVSGTEEKNSTQNENTNKKGYISGDDVNFREQASTSAEVLDVLELNTEVTIIEENKDWYKIKVGNNEGYVSKDYVSNSKTKETTSRGGVERINNTTTGKVTGNDIVEYAKKYLGYPYVYAQESPNVGFDCSGLVWYVYKHFGYTVSRSSSALANDGKTISNKKDLKPGDILVFLAYNDYSRVGHVGIYIGNNQFIHANDESTGVIITSLDSGKYPERFVSGRRIIE